jgi:hypothetical protein
MDVFRSDAFSMMELTAAINDVPYVPGRVGELGVFSEASVRTTLVSIEKQGATLALIPVTARGAPPVQNKKDGRTMYDFRIPRLAVSDTVSAEEVQGIRAFGTESEIKAVQTEVMERGVRMARNLDATLEHHRMGALKGIVYDADGTTPLLNLFTAFGVSAQTEIAWNIDGTSVGDLRPKVSALIRSIEDELGGLQYSSILVLTSAQFFDDLTQHGEVRETYLYQQGSVLRERVARRALDFGGVRFEEYRGSVGGVKYIADDKAIAFPMGVTDLFITRFGPADYWDTVNTPGLPRYMRQWGDEQQANRYRVVEVQTNPIHICTRPRVLFPIRRGA